MYKFYPDTREDDVARAILSEAGAVETRREYDHDARLYEQ